MPVSSLSLELLASTSSQLGLQTIDPLTLTVSLVMPSSVMSVFAEKFDSEQASSLPSHRQLTGKIHPLRIGCDLRSVLVSVNMGICTYYVEQPKVS